MMMMMMMVVMRYTADGDRLILVVDLFVDLHRKTLTIGELLRTWPLRYARKGMWRLLMRLLLLLFQHLLLLRLLLRGHQIEGTL
uniref:Putative secreted peptide n=1 Tax=Anopheles braziliensis TaxID=58242 RepID=A0A2M3ZPJ8_9DIPT